MKPISEEEVQAELWFRKAHGVTFKQVMASVRLYSAIWFVVGLVTGFLVGYWLG